MRFTSPLPSAKVVDRESFILSRCHGARVLHLGCVDSGLLEERLSCGNLLHAALAKASRDLWGIDLDAAGLQTRIGASSLLNDILMQLRKEKTGAYQSPDYFTLD